MSKHYNTNQSGGSRIFSALGFAFAAILMIGALGKMGFSITTPENQNEPVGIQPLTADASLESDYEKSNRSDNPIRLSDNMDVEPAPHLYEDKPISSSVSPTEHALQAGNWVERFSETAHQQALEKGIPAGIALAVGISQLEHGAIINSWDDFMNAVVEPLLEIKGATSERNIQTYFKYSANSERWAEGLGKTGTFSETKLKQILRQYDLTFFDQEVRQTLVKGTASNPETDRKASFVADEVANSIRREKEKISRTVQTTSDPEQVTNAADTKDLYNEVVGYDVAKKIAEEKLATGQYVTEKDIERLIQETNTETSKAMQNSLGFMGRKINERHPDAGKLKDVSNPANAQARQELYLEKLKKMRGGNKE